MILKIKFHEGNFLERRKHSFDWKNYLVIIFTEKFYENLRNVADWLYILWGI